MKLAIALDIHIAVIAIGKDDNHTLGMSIVVNAHLERNLIDVTIAVHVASLPMHTNHRSVLVINSHAIYRREERTLGWKIIKSAPPKRDFWRLCNLVFLCQDTTHLVAVNRLDRFCPFWLAVSNGDGQHVDSCKRKQRSKEIT